MHTFRTRRPLLVNATQCLHPTTILTDKHGRIFSRMNGFKPERFVDMLTTRIRDALGN